MENEEKGILVEPVITAETKRDDGGRHEWLFLAVRFLYYILGSIGFAGGILWTFRVPMNRWLFFVSIFVICAAFTALYTFGKMKITVIAGVGFLLLYSLVFHEKISEGLQCIYNLYIEQINSYYNVHAPLAGAADLSPEGQLISVIPVLVFFLGLLGAGMIYYLDARLTAFIMAIPLALALAVGMFPVLPSAVLMIAALIGTFFLQYTRHHDSLHQDYIMVQLGNGMLDKLRAQTAIIAAAALLVAGCTSLFALGPAVNSVYESQEKLRDDIRSGEFLDDMRTFWKKLMRGEWDWLPFDIIRSSGVNGGKLSNVKEVRDYGELHLYLDISDELNAPFYIRGYVGTNYTGKGWRGQSSAQMEQAAAAGKTAADLTGQYYSLLEKMQQERSAPVYGRLRYVITNINANPEYSYLPYGSNIGNFPPSEAYDTYTADITDENIFDLYYLNTQKLSNLEAIERAGAENHIDDAYRNFAKSAYMSLPVEGLDRFYAEYRGKSFDSVADTVKFVRESLAEHAEYTMIPGSTPKDSDYVEYFLYENHQGYCTHFATAGVLLFRMYGIPARYVEGYLTTSLSSGGPGAGPNRIMDDAAHAWVEIYVDGAGWLPIEVTPGFVNEEDMIDDRESPISRDELPDIEQTTEAPEPTAPEETKPAEPTTQEVQPSKPAMQPTKPAQNNTRQETRPQEENTESKSPEMSPVLRLILRILIILLIVAAVLLLAAFLIAARYRKYRRKYELLCKRSPRDAVLASAAEVDRISSAEGLCLDEYSDFGSIQARYPFVTEEGLKRYQSLCLEAGFSRHPFDEETGKEMMRFCSDFASGIVNGSSKLKKLYLRYIKCYL